MSKPLLVATLGPASFEFAQDIVDAGATALRLNGSHMSSEKLSSIVDNVRKQLADVPIVVDLQGAKMRLGKFEPRTIIQDETLQMALESDSVSIPLPHPEIFSAVIPGNTLSCDDGRIRLRVEHCESGRLSLTSLTDGILKPRKGINVVEHPVHLSDLTALDVAQLEVCRAFSHVSFACSFMHDGREAQWIRSRIPNANVVGKVERSEAVKALPTLASYVQSIWICRGDLGAQLGLGPMARWVSEFRPTSIGVPTIIAGQVLEHLTNHPNPTRSEVCHLGDLLQRGYAGVVLSDETAIGVDPVHATKVTRELLASLV